MNLQDKAKEWIALKAKEDEAKKARVAIEQEILSSFELEKKDGANNLENMLTITGGYSRSWDQEGLDHLRSLGTDPFPFKIELKEDRKLSKALEEMAPDFWKAKFEPLLTVKPKKPSFKVR